MALRLLTLFHKKFGVKAVLNESVHFPTFMKKAYRKYIQYREENPEMLVGIMRNGLKRKMQNIYRMARVSPSDEAVNILGWDQRDGRKAEGTQLPDFSEMTSAELVDALKETKLSPTVALSILPQKKITASVAKALLENCTGNQSIILYNWFSRNGFMDIKEINDLFAKKVKTSTTAIDRIDTLSRDADEKDKKVLSEIRSQKRKDSARTGGLGKIFLHIDKSSSMSGAIEFAKDRASVIAECLENPSENFAWGLFGSKPKVLPLPSSFKKEDFHEALYGVSANEGSTDCIGLYEQARKFGANIDIYVTDEGHNVGDIVRRVNDVHSRHPEFEKPKVVLIVRFGVNSLLETAMRNLGIPVTIIMPNSLQESALVAQSIKTALVGELAIIDEILETPLPKLPNWWNKLVCQPVKRENLTTAKAPKKKNAIAKTAKAKKPVVSAVVADEPVKRKRGRPRKVKEDV
jgi:hypothetical protein